jgi:formate dehydrogenase subunit gamma
MLAHRVSRWLAGLVLALSVLTVAQPALAADRVQEQVQRQETQPLNNAPVWRDVRGGDINQYQTTQVRGVESSVLVQSEGEIWRQVRNGPITVYGGWLLVAVLLLLGAYFAIKGPIRLPEKPSGRLMPRFSPWDRIVHWSTAITFILLSVTGMITLFGKYVLLPVFGYALFSWIASLA